MTKYILLRPHRFIELLTKILPVSNDGTIQLTAASEFTSPQQRFKRAVLATSIYSSCLSWTPENN
jgi:hypothetical protein